MNKLIKNKYFKYFLVSLVIMMVFSIPFFSGQIKVGPDTTFHINRINALAYAIENGDLYPSIFYDQNYNFGYGSPMFYSLIYLYPAALLKIIGISSANVYRIFTSLIIFFASFSMMYATDKIVKNKNNVYIYIIATLYVLNNYTLNRVYKRGAIGEILAMIFIPIVLMQIHKVIFEHKNNWIGLGLSFAALLLAHNISFVLMVLLFVFLITFNIKNIFKNKSYITILKAGILGFLLCLFYILPMLEQLSNDIYFINSSFKNKTNRLQGSSILDLLTYVGDDTIGITFGIGPAILLIPLCALFKKKFPYMQYLIAGYILLFMTTYYFPWKYTTIVNFIQFPSRMIIVALPLLCIVCAYIFEIFKNNKNIKLFIIVCLILSFLSFSKTSYDLRFKAWGAINDDTSDELIKTGEGLYLEKDINFWYNIPEVSSPEYLPVEVCDYYDNSFYPKVYGDSKEYDITYRNYNENTVELVIDQDNLNLAFPLVYYKGYVVEVYKDGDYLDTLKTSIDKSERFVSVDIPSNYIGQDLVLIARYNGTKIQKVSMIISISTFISMIIYQIKNRKIAK